MFIKVSQASEIDRLKFIPPSSPTDYYAAKRPPSASISIEPITTETLSQGSSAPSEKSIAMSPRQKVEAVVEALAPELADLAKPCVDFVEEEEEEEEEVGEEVRIFSLTIQNIV